MKKSLILLSVLSLVALSPAQQSQLLRIKAKQGQKFNYLMTVDGGSGAQTMKMSMQMNMKIAGATKNQVTIHSTIGTTSMNGQPMPAAAAEQLKKLLIVTTMDELGRVLKSETRGVPGMTGNGMEGSSVPFPATPVTVGSTWSGKSTFQGKKYDTSYKVIRFKSVLGRPAAVIHATPKGIPQLKLSEPIVFSVELASGFPISMNMKGTVNNGTGNQKIKMTMVRL